MSLIGYARVCAEQDLALQLDALRAAGATRIFEDRGVSGARTERHLKTRSTGSPGTKSGDIQGRSIPVSDPPNFRT